jgi:hypothetical protein
MSDLKLGKLPNRTRTKLTLELWPELDDHLRLYATLHSALYGQEVSAADVAPFILAAYLETDREFQKARRAAKPKGSA